MANKKSCKHWLRCTKHNKPMQGLAKRIGWAVCTNHGGKSPQCVEQYTRG